MGKILDWLKTGWERGLQGTRQARIYRAALAAVLLLGVVMRLLGQISNQSSLWLDEALWAVRLVRDPLLSLSIRPIGFMWLSKQLVSLFGATEFWLRFLPNIAGIAALLITPYIASRLFTRRLLRLLFVLFFALHPALIEYSKEFKPYSFEVLVHLVPLALYLRYRETNVRKHLYALLAVLPVLFLFAYNIAFAFPGLLLLGLHASWLDRRWRGAAAAAASAIACLAVLATVYSAALTDVIRDQTTDYWGKKYDVFYQPNSQKHAHDTRVDWITEKYNDIAALPGMRRELWQAPHGAAKPLLRELRAAERLFWVILHFLGLYYMFSRQRHRELLLLAVPTLCLILVNLLGKWPFGAFRTNLFLCVYALPISVMGLEFLARKSTSRLWAVAGVTALLTLLPGFALGFDWQGRKQLWTREHYQRQVLERLRLHRERELVEDGNRPPARLLLDSHTSQSYYFYLNTHPVTAKKHGPFFARHFTHERESSNATRMNRKLRMRLESADQPLWVVLSDPRSKNSVREYAKSIGEVLTEEPVGSEHLILQVNKK